MRLADQIVASGLTPIGASRLRMPGSHESQLKAQQENNAAAIKQSIMEGAPILKVDNVCDYVEARFEKQSIWEMLGVLRLPYPQMWMEWKAPGPMLALGVMRQLGCFIFESPRDKEGLRRVTLLPACAPFRNLAPVLMDISISAWIDDLGRHEKRVAIFDGDKEASEEVISHASHFAWPAFLSVSFLNCKNVAQRQDNPSEALQKAFLRRHGRPMLKFKTLEIEPMKRVFSSEGGIETNGLKKALHICRGHFATYDEKPLFGKVKGTFWVPQHVKGSAIQGTIVKDYSVKAPAVKSA